MHKHILSKKSVKIFLFLFRRWCFKPINKLPGESWKTHKYLIFLIFNLEYNLVKSAL